MIVPDPTLPHGSTSTYSNHRCRCTDCRIAWARYVRRRKAARRDEIKVEPNRAPHGRASTYGNWGCRCDECRAAFTDDCRRRRDVS